MVLDHAPWHRGALMTAVLKEWPPIERSRWPSDSPHLQLIERCWKVLRRRATHNRLLRALGQLKQTLRNSLCYDQTLRHRVLSLIQPPRKRTKLSAA
ncbi:MAG TPA: transposase [Candidatus Tectomicrobia bacterium]|nr:transposase [Candidatus Tectomicrobia bacterium]